MTIKHLRLGTRGSPLALTQANMVKDALLEKNPNLEIEIVTILTSGDWKPSDGETRLKDEDGGKGQFAKEIEAALLSGRIDAAVHSAKDMETTLPDGLVLGCYLPREDARDALIINGIAKNSQNKLDLKNGATIGTASVRRQAFLKHVRPDLNIVPFRGNVQTRLDKLAAGQVDATLLALAGLKRLSLEEHASLILEIEDFIPAATQGAVCIEYRENEKEIISIFSQINCEKTILCAECERAVIRVLDGSCHTPIGAYAEIKDDIIHVRTAIASLDGTQYFEEQNKAPVQTIEQAVKLGEETGHTLKAKIPAALLTQKADD